MFKWVVTWTVSKGIEIADISCKYRYFSRKSLYRWYRVLGIDFGLPYILLLVYCENGVTAKTSPRNEVISSFWNHERSQLSSFKQLCLVRRLQRVKWSFLGYATSLYFAKSLNSVKSRIRVVSVLASKGLYWSFHLITVNGPMIQCRNFTYVILNSI